MNNLSMYLRAILRQEKYGSTNYTIAEYLISNYEDITNLSTSHLAEACMVSKASISRFCKNIGVEDFHELKYLAKQPGADSRKKFAYERYSDHELYDYLQFVQNKVNSIKDKLDMELTDALVDDIFRYKKVVLMGISQSINPAFNLQQDLTYLNKSVYCTDSIIEQKEILMSSNEETLVIVFSASGTFFKQVLPRIRVLERTNRPCIYMVSCKEVEKPSYIKDILLLDDHVNYASNLLMSVFSHLLILRYKSKYFLDE